MERKGTLGSGKWRDDFRFLRIIFLCNSLLYSLSFGQKSFVKKQRD